MVHIRYKTVLRSKFILFVVFCGVIPPQLCREIEDFDILDDGLVDGTQRVERAVDYEPLVTEDRHETCVDQFCENVVNYPLSGVNNAIQNLPNEVYQGLQGDFIEIGNRLSSGEGDLLCNTTQLPIYPQKGNNTKNKEVFIVNVPKKPQKIIVSICSKENKSGKCGNSILPDGYTSECKQQYAQVNLLVYNAKGGEDVAEFDSFKIPSCCLCWLTKTNRK